MNGLRPPDNDHVETPNRWHSVEEIRSYLGVPESQILQWINRGGMPAYRVVNEWKFQREEVDAWVRGGGAMNAPSIEPNDPNSAAEHDAVGRLRLAEERFGHDEFEVALEMSRALVADSRVSHETRWAAHICASRALVATARYRDALSWLGSVLPESRGEQGELNAHRMRVHIELGEYSQAVALARAIIFAQAELPAEPVAMAASLLVYVGHCREALSVIARLETLPDFRIRRRVFGAYVSAGAAKDAHRVLNSIPQTVRSLPEWRPRLEEFQVALGLFEGNLAGMEDRIHSLINSVPAQTAQAYAVDLVTLATLRGQPAPRSLLREDVPPLEGYLRSSWLCELARNDLRHRGAVGVPLPNFSHEEAAWLRVYGQIVTAETALVSSDETQALEAGRRAVAIATAAGAYSLMAEAWISLANTLIVFAPTMVQEAISAISAIEKDSGAKRLAIERAWLTCAAQGPSDYRTLESIAADDDANPIASRRARALLGGDPSLDRIDRIVLDAIKSRTYVLSLRAVHSHRGPWCPGWCFDPEQSKVMYSDGREVDLGQRSVQTAVLRKLFETASASKGDLVRATWGVHEYHPLRHDKRLHNAIRAVRDTIEDDATRPTRIITTQDGYALGTRERALILHRTQ